MKKLFCLISCILISMSLHAEVFKAAAVEFNPKLLAFEANLSGIEAKTLDAAKQGARLIVLPEMATTGLIYKDRAQIEPFLDTIPGKTTALLEGIAKKYHTYIVVGVAEKDPDSHLYYNAAALIGPKGYIGKYRKNGLNTLDEKWASKGNLGIPVFKTEIGNIALLICYDDSYLEYLLLPALRGADIIAFISAPGQFLLNETGAIFNHSTIANIATLSGWVGTYIVATSRTGLESNPNTHQTLHYVGGASIWDPNGNRLAQANVSRVNHLIASETIIADINTTLYQNEAKQILETRRRPSMYQIENLARTINDPNASKQPKHIDALLIQYTPTSGDKSANLKKILKLINKNTTLTTNLIVMPENSLIGEGSAKQLIIHAEELSGNSVQQMANIAKTHHSYLVFSMPLKEAGHYYSAAILMNNLGKVVGIYRKTHLNESERTWASAGDELSVFETPLGRIGLMIGDEVTVPDLTNVMAMNRADVIIVPSAWHNNYGKPIEVDPRLLTKPYPKNTMTLWYNVARYAQAYTLVANYVGGPLNYQGSSALYTLDPVEAHYPPVTADATSEMALRVYFDTLGKKDWWMNQDDLIMGKRVELHAPLTLEYQSPCFKAWRQKSNENDFCWNH